MSNTKKFSLVWISFWFGLAILSNGFEPAYQLEKALMAPSWPHPFGFDALGQDFLLVTLTASLRSSAFALFAVILSIGLGITVGCCIALSSNRSQFYFSRGLETFLAFPSLLFALGWAAVRGPGWTTLLFALLIGTVPNLTRLVHVRAKEILQEEYVSASYGIGAKRSWILSRHLLPEILSLCSVKFPNLFAHALMAEATVSFLGVGAPIGQDTWGSLIAQGKDYLLEAPHIAIGAGIPLVLMILSLQILSAELFENRRR